MPGYHAYYISLFFRPPDFYAALQNTFPRLIVERDAAFAAVEYEPKFTECRTEFIKQLSRDGEALFISACADAEEFHYEKWNNCNLTRALSYSTAQGWQRVDGEIPDDWELSYLFAEYRLEQAISRLKANDELKAQSEAWLRQLWKEKLLVRHLHEPRVDVMQLSGYVSEYMRVPLLRFDRI